MALRGRHAASSAQGRFKSAISFILFFSTLDEMTDIRTVAKNIFTSSFIRKYIYTI
jgi:hypothetical protein